mgnify:CR=1 FL=1
MELKEALSDIYNMFGDAAAGGCIQVFSDGKIVTIRWGECTSECTAFNGCMRSRVRLFDESPSEQAEAQYQ